MAEGVKFPLYIFFIAGQVNTSGLEVVDLWKKGKSSSTQSVTFMYGQSRSSFPPAPLLSSSAMNREAKFAFHRPLLCLRVCLGCRSTKTTKPPQQGRQQPPRSKRIVSYFLL